MAIFYQDQAQWLYDVAREKNNLHDVFTDIQLFKKGVGGELPFMQMMTRENITNSSKASLLKDIAQYFHVETRQFIQGFIDEAQYSTLYHGIKAFEDIYEAHRLTIISAVALLPEQINRIVKGFERQRQQTFHTIEQKIDESVIGGVSVKSKDFIVDKTLLAMLKEFKKSI